MKTYTCEACGGTFTSERDDEEAHAEAEARWGVRGDAPFMAEICEDCYRELLTWLRQQESSS